MLASNYASTSSSQNYNTKFLDYIKANKLQDNPDNIEIGQNKEVETLNDLFNINELKQAIKGAKLNKSPGDDKIPYELLKHLHKNALKVLLHFYNDIYINGKMPKDWQHAIIIPILKPNKNASLPESYRPISLTSTLCKIMEKLVGNRLQWYLEKNNFITNNQSGFRKHKNTMDQILKLQDKILKSLKNKESVLAVFIDFERAYDMLHVPTLLRKLHKLGIYGNITKWIKNFISNRTFQVKVGTELFDKLLQENGTPQGSIISPLLFLLMINDITKGPDDVNLSLFADDSAVYLGNKSVKWLEIQIQKSLDAIEKWCNENGFKISIAKTTGVLFTRKMNQKFKINLKVGDKYIKMDNKAKFLGVIFDSKLNWNSHIEYIIEKCKKRLNLMRAVSGNSWGASKKSMLTIYKALIRPILDYGDVAYASASKTTLNKLNHIQTEALRLSCGAPKGTAASALCNECGEVPLQLRRLENSIKMGVKISSIKDHPCKSAMKIHKTDLCQATTTQDVSIYNRTEEFMKKLDNLVIGPSFPSSPPWINKRIKIDTSLTKQINKTIDNPEFLKQAALQTITKYSTMVNIYTDGSKKEDNVAAAFTIPVLNIDKQFKLCKSSSIYAAELTAIKEAVIWIHNEGIKDKKYAIFSDSLSVLTSIKENKSKSRPKLFNELLIQINKIEINTVEIIWIPSHVGLIGNERVDKLAKEALKLESENSTNYLELDEALDFIKPYIIDKWQKVYDQDPVGKFYKMICPIVSKNIKYIDPIRSKEVQISRLRLGVANTNSRLFKMGRHPTGNCETCQVKDDIEHLLLKCIKNDISIELQNKCTVYKNEFSLKSLLGVGFLHRDVIWGGQGGGICPPPEFW